MVCYKYNLRCFGVLPHQHTSEPKAIRPTYPLTMFLTQVPRFPSFPKKHSLPPVCYDVVARSFDDAILRRLKALNQPASAPIGLSWLSLAIDFLSFAHTEARTLLSNLHLSPDSDDSLAGYLDGALKLLDLCNSITSLIERLRLRRLSINFVLQLLAPSDSGFPAPEKLRRARDSLSDWEKPSVGLEKRGFRSSPEDLIRDLAAGLGDAPRGKISSADKLLRRTIHALGLLTVFFGGVLVSALYGSPKMAAVRVPAEFSWADSFNALESSVSTELTRRFLVKELDDVGTRTREVREAIDGMAEAEEDKGRERLNGAVGELKIATEVFSEGLDRLSNGVNGMFQTVLCSRGGVIENVRVGQRKEKQPPK
ncbi:hypothetical protein FH972_008722 [Carpinus fangiana]|uniref:Uncharacterized protein n=1 Tax=Carpinus fangiana TaxID=176857 RepID=A0A5N6R1U1_9ROSI|nr:hypothetical protein FH972_008722 [Carpinus fangiana]